MSVLKTVSYNSLNHLLSVIVNKEESYLFNENTNLLNKGDLAFTLQEGGNEIVSYQSSEATLREFVYDEQGRVSTMKGEGIDDLNCLYTPVAMLPTTVTQGSSALHSFYGVEGNRIWRECVLDNVTTAQAFLYGKNGASPLMDIDEKGNEVIHIMVGDNRMVIDDSHKVHYILQDYLSSTRHLIGQDGIVESNFEYDPYGNLLKKGGDSAKIDYLFNGQYYESPFNLYHFKIRTYSPQMGSFFLLDPKNQHYNPYGYCNGNPINFTDRTGGIDIPIMEGLESFHLPLPNEDIDPMEYNCHAYAWTDAQGLSVVNHYQYDNDMGKRTWINHPAPFMREFEALDFREPNMPEDRVIYFETSPVTDITSDSIKIAHSAIVHEVDANGRTIRVRSKDGFDDKLIVSQPRDSRYGVKSPIVEFQGQRNISRRYYRSKNKLVEGVTTVKDPLIDIANTPNLQMDTLTIDVFVKSSSFYSIAGDGLPTDSILLSNDFIQSDVDFIDFQQKGLV